ncbi:putative alcohol dehydrogenase [Halenospora varia]|nr:putative alcohol dehydrogenase [Halenospora varia]
MSLPATYKQAAFLKQGEPLTIQEVPLSLPAAGEILVKVEACGVCFSDMYAQHNVMGGGFPLVPGHEIIGRVAAVGDENSAWKVGDRIGGAWHGGHDGSCHACRKGHYQMCDNRVVNGETKQGGYAEYCKIRTEAAVRIGDQIDAAKFAPVMCAGVSVFNSMRVQNIPPGSIVAIQGLGGLGHLAVQYANKMGFKVVALSRGADKEQFAKDLGAHVYIDSSKVDPAEALQKMGGAKLIVTTAPAAEVISPLLKGLGILGKLLILSVPGKVEIDTVTMLTYGLSVQVWPSGHAQDTEEAVEFADMQNINCMVEKFPLDKANEAFDAMMKGTVRFRAVITM